ncbi:hypothetical protein MuYL_3142 [Mucilaginibacter xinganensis]|uniref:Uncharacterized protein n=1 Tax=Mucilaginibacter xinganensis TaxID=1234841 RepID=A0A223NYS2_9SPHI|nr:hypothetical protein MuYL_3142 [Mucilaginibacter xinganensis]
MNSTQNSQDLFSIPVYICINIPAIFAIKNRQGNMCPCLFLLHLNVKLKEL